jgi:hypothetical protein
MAKIQKVQVGTNLTPENEVHYYNRQKKTWVTEKANLVVEKIIEHKTHQELKCIVGTDTIMGYKTLWIRLGRICFPDEFNKKKKSFKMPVEADVKIIYNDSIS